MTKKIIQLNIQTLNINSFNVYKHFLEKSFKLLNFKYTFFILPKEKKRITLLRSPHVNKTSREQFEIHYYKGIFQIDTFNNNMILNWLLCNKPSTVQTKIKFKSLGV